MKRIIEIVCGKRGHPAVQHLAFWCALMASLVADVLFHKSGYYLNTPVTVTQKLGTHVMGVYHMTYHEYLTNQFWQVRQDSVPWDINTNVLEQLTKH